MQQALAAPRGDDAAADAAMPPRYDHQRAATHTVVRYLTGVQAQGHSLTDLLGDEGYAPYRHQEIVSRIADRLSTELVSDEVACECLLDSMVLTLDLADWRAVAAQVGFPFEQTEPATGPGYTDALNPETQVDAEEGIAALIFDATGDDEDTVRVGEEMCAELGRRILMRILGQFRPDLYRDAQDSRGTQTAPAGAA